MREVTVALELISRMKSAMPVESDDSYLSLYLADTSLAFISACQQFLPNTVLFLQVTFSLSLFEQMQK